MGQQFERVMGSGFEVDRTSNNAYIDQDILPWLDCQWGQISFWFVDHIDQL